MKYCKIDIKQEFLDLENKIYHYFVQLYDDVFEPVNENDIPDKMVNIKKIEYMAREIYNPTNGKIEKYLIREDERGIVENLIQIYNDDLETYVRKRIKKVKNDIEKGGIVVENNRIKHLSWWKRLFNKF